jgi:hypothetical protein
VPAVQAGVNQALQWYKVLIDKVIHENERLNESIKEKNVHITKHDK